MRDAFKCGPVIEILRDPHIIIEGHVFRHVTESRARLERLLKNIEARDRGATGRGRAALPPNEPCSLFSGPRSVRKNHYPAPSDLAVPIPTIPGSVASARQRFNLRY